MVGRTPLRVAVVGTNDPRNFSGGRYHAAMLAYAIAAAGGDPCLVTDHAPAFLTDLESLAPGRVQLSLTSDFRRDLPPGDFDWVVVIPTGIFMPEFYEAALAFAAERKARVALLNFESANWFNAEAPEPRDPQLWDYWRRTVGRGGLVLSSARTSDAWARRFYHAWEGQIRFEVWCPPINSLAIRRFDGLAKDGSILCFVRPQDSHKGSALLAMLPPAALAGRTLRLVAGRDMPDEFRAKLSAAVASADGARVEFLTRISDTHKARLLTQAQAVLFPSRFEGFGYPPVEAAYAGTESVCFPLPVLQETVGGIAHFAADFSPGAFCEALQAALAQPERQASLRRAVFDFADFHEAAWLLADILLRSGAALPPHQRPGFAVPVGPFHRARPLAPEHVDRAAALPKLPPTVISARRGTANDILVSVAWDPLSPFDALEGRGPEDQRLLVVPEHPASGPQRFHLVLPGDMLGGPIRVRALERQQLVEEVLLWPNAVLPATPNLGVRCGISEQRETKSGLLIRGWVLAARPLKRILISGEGSRWVAADVSVERRDVHAKHPEYPTARIEFRLILPGKDTPDPQHALILGLGEDGLVDLLSAWPPSPRSAYEGGVARLAPLRGEGSRPVAQGEEEEALPRRRRLGQMELAPLNDAEFRNGVSKLTKGSAFGAVMVHGMVAGLEPGSVLRFAGGEVRRIRKIEAKGKAGLLHLDGPVSPGWSGHPAKVEVFAAQDPELTPPTPGFWLSGHSDKLWRRGVWDAEDEQKHRLFFMSATEAQALNLAPGRELVFARSGPRVIEQVSWSGRNCNVLLDRMIDPEGDGQPARVLVPPSQAELDAAFDGRPVALGIAPRHASAEHAVLAGRRLPPPGTGLASETGEGFRLMAVGADESPPRLLLNRRIAGPNRRLRVVPSVDLPDGLPENWAFPEAEFPQRDPLCHRLVARALRSGEGIPPAKPGPGGGRARLLLVSLVSPAPANQGNRVVTRNLIRHWLDLGFDVDLLVQNWIDVPAMTSMFGSRVRTFCVTFPDWEKSPAVTLRTSLAQSVTSLGATPSDTALTREVADKLQVFDPFFIIRDETVRRAEELLVAGDYAAIICNYTHCVRVVAELASRRPLPPVAVITHDALSRLPREFGGKRLDTSYRLASEAGEKAALDALPGAVVVAISSSEAEYFREIGVTNQIVLCEYDAWEELQDRRVDHSGFAARHLVFPASANPMNIAGMNWFLEQCWPTIRRAVPDARLTICGSVSGALATEPEAARAARGIEALGVIERDALLDLCSASSILINPCVAGTGLKIKTVEAAAAGLPVVCLPSAVDGLEEDAILFALVAREAREFSEACISLLTDEALWLSLHEGALALAESRFSRHHVYEALDTAMGLRKTAPGAADAGGGPETRRLPSLATAASRLEADPLDPDALMVLAAQLIRSKQQAAGWSLVRDTLRRRPGDPLLACLAGQLALQANEPWDAVMLGARLVAGDPAHAEGFRLMGLGLLEIGRADDAIAALEQAVLLAPSDARAAEGLALALSRRGRVQEASLWADRIGKPPALGEYVVLSLSRLPAAMQNGWLAGDPLRLPPGGEGRFLAHLPREAPDTLWLELDLRAATGTEWSDVTITIAGRARQIPLGGQGSIRTATLPILAAGQVGGPLEIGLSLPKHGGTTEVLGFILHGEPPQSLSGSNIAARTGSLYS